MKPAEKEEKKNKSNRRSQTEVERHFGEGDIIHHAYEGIEPSVTPPSDLP